MSIQDTANPLILDSPIEFVITGPLGGRDRLLVKSKEAGLDIVGLAAAGRASSVGSSDLLSVLLGGSPPVNKVSSFPLDDIAPESDSRASSYILAWRGHASPQSLGRVEKTLNLQLVDLQRAIKHRDKPELEFALGPVIYRCSLANERRLRSRRLLQGTLLAYLAIGLLAAMWSIFRIGLRTL
jgi:hypothetical protein